jgi:hypothetical protein
MATAKAGPRRTTRQVTLKLTEGEADFLLAVLAMTGGHPSKSPRKYAKRVTKALEGAVGYGFEETDAYELGIGDISFRDYGSAPFTGLDRFADAFGHEVAGVLYV